MFRLLSASTKRTSCRRMLGTAEAFLKQHAGRVLTYTFRAQRTML